MISSYLIDVIILLMAAVVAVPLSQSIRLGAVPGFLIAGVIVGPYGLGLINNINEIGSFAEIGVVLLLFVIGMELKPSRLWQMRRFVFGLGTLQVLLTGMVTGGVGYIFFDIPMRAAILVGPALAISSTAFVLQLLTEQKSLISKYGRTSIAVLLLQDLAVVPLLALVPLLAVPELSIGKDIGLALAESLLIIGLVILAGRYFLHPILHRVALSGNPEVFTGTAVLIVLGTAVLTEHTGLSMAMGAFLAGLLISNSSYRHQIMAEIMPFRGLLIGLFFMYMGMSLNINILFENPILSSGLVILLILIKVAVLYPIARWFKLNKKNSMAVSLVLAQSGEFAMILFSLAFRSDILTEKLFEQLLLVILLSMLATPALAYLARRVVKYQNTEKEKIAEIPAPAPIVLAGFGRVGRRIGNILSLAGKRFAALDSDALIVRKERANGQPVFYGDVRKPGTLNAAGVGNARVIIVTLNDPNATEQLVSSLSKMYPDINIYARGHSLRHCSELRKLGASGVVSENIEASLELARMVLINIQVNEKKQKAILEDFRRKYHAEIEDLIGNA